MEESRACSFVWSLNWYECPLKEIGDVIYILKIKFHILSQCRQSAPCLLKV
jgi:hypothetical protein